MSSVFHNASSHQNANMHQDSMLLDSDNFLQVDCVYNFPFPPSPKTSDSKIFSIARVFFLCSFHLILSLNRYRAPKFLEYWPTMTFLNYPFSPTSTCERIRRPRSYNLFLSILNSLQALPETTMNIKTHSLNCFYPFLPERSCVA